MMRKNGFDTLAFVLVLGAVALVVLATAGTGPALSDDSRTDPAEVHRTSAAKRPSGKATPATPQPEPATDEIQEKVPVVEYDGYEWSGSRPADQRYLWSHQPG
jgi:hypothetical protein